MLPKVLWLMLFAQRSWLVGHQTLQLHHEKGHFARSNPTGAEGHEIIGIHYFKLYTSYLVAKNVSFGGLWACNEKQKSIIWPNLLQMRSVILHKGLFARTIAVLLLTLSTIAQKHQHVKA